MFQKRQADTDERASGIIQREKIDAKSASRVLYQNEANKAARADARTMTPSSSNPIGQHIHRAVTAQLLGEATDAVLLERFASRQDEAAFAVLVRRHGPMVQGVCRRVLHNLHDAEDAFQATFLLLARKAGSIRQRESLAGWLFAVGRRLAVKARVRAERRRALEDRVKAMLPTEPNDLSAFGAEQRAILDEELERLPEKYRTVLVVCCLQGKTRAEAAHHLGWKPGAVKIRLERGRDLLRSRLTRRGLALSAGTLAAVLAETGTASAVSPTLVDATIRGAMLLGAGKAALAGVVSENALALMEGMRKTMFMTKLKIAFVALLAVGVMGGGTTWLFYPNVAAQAPENGSPAPPVAAAPQAPDKEANAEPLPAGARARLGASPFRCESNATLLGYTPDGAYLLAAIHMGPIVKQDARTGKEVLRFGNPPIDPKPVADKMNLDRLYMAATPALTPSGKIVATGWPGNTIRLWNVATGKPICQWETPNRVVALVFSPNGSALASLGDNGLLYLWDVAQGKEIRQFGEQQKPRAERVTNLHGPMAFSADGKVLLVPGVEARVNKGAVSFVGTVVKRWEVASGKEWSKAQGRQWDKATIAPDGKTIAWVENRSGKARLFDLDTGKDLREIQGIQTVIAFSADSKLLVAKTVDGLGIWETATGKNKLTATWKNTSGDLLGGIFNAHGGLVRQAVFSADGSKLAAEANGVIRQWNLASGKEMVMAVGHADAVAAVAVLPDGQTVLTWSRDNTLRTWDAQGREIRKWTLPVASRALFSADGQTLVLGYRTAIHVWDTKAGKELHHWKAHDKDIGGLAITTDGKRIASRGYDRTIRLWDAATGKELRRLVEPDKDGGFEMNLGIQDSSWLPLTFSSDGINLAIHRTGLQVSPNGRQRPEAEKEARIRILDLNSGLDAFRPFANGPRLLTPAVFSPDNRTFAVANDNGTVSLWETLSGNERLQVSSGRCTALAFSPNGKMLVTAGYSGKIDFWDAATGKKLAERRSYQPGTPMDLALPGIMDQTSIASLAISADGKTLVSGSNDTTALIWDMPNGEDAKPPVQLENAQIEALWNDLAGADAAKARQAILVLGAHPAQTMPFLQGRLKPVPAPDPKRIAQLIADLDNQQFAARQKAEDELEKLGQLAVSALKKTLQSQPSLEVRQRVGKLLERTFVRPTPVADVLQSLRALALLEDLGTNEARQLLDQLSQGAPDARQTREAKAVLARLNASAKRRQGTPAK